MRRSRPWCAVTNNYQFDGFGSQYLSIMGAIAFARCQNLTFCYTPLRTMDHNGEGRREYLREVQDLMNIGEPAFPVGGASHLQSSTHDAFGPSGSEPLGHMGTGQWLVSHVEQPWPDRLNKLSTSMSRLQLLQLVEPSQPFVWQ